MKLSDFIEFEAIVSDLSSGTRDESIRELVMSLARVGRINEDKVDEITRDLIKRENQGSTGIGKGISVPHLKHSSVTEIVGTIGISKAGLDFSSLDKAPVYSVVLLLSPTNDPDRHLEAMENLFSHLQKDLFRKFLRQSETKKMVIDLILEADEAQQDGNI
ncbi:MAG: PTS sugar transporter subunit IIA [Planctomycetes bacterium]|nr:PTS sugar transporter subunit IIA [Planctomycetota bacterium]